MSHRCLHRRFSRAATIESNESIRPLRAFTLVNLSRTAIEQLPEPKAENVYIVTCHFDSIQQKLRRTSWRMWLCTVNFYFLNHFQSLWSSFPLLFFAMHLIFTHFYNWQLNRQIIRRVENADVYTDDLVVRQQSNRTKREPFYFSWNETLADWSRRNTASFDSDRPT
jgi:hypothetical protein